jgi:hypothetical protein
MQAGRPQAGGLSFRQRNRVLAELRASNGMDSSLLFGI